MKKRSILLSVLLIVTMLVTGCGNSTQSLEGKWVGSIDVTKQFEDGVKAAYPDLAEYVDFEELVFVLDIEFVEGQMAMAVQQESINAFNASFATGMEAIAKDYWEAGLAKTSGLTLEEAIYESGMSEEAYSEYIYKETGIDKMITAMTDATNTTLDKLSNMKGTYTTVGDELRLYYTEDNQNYEAMEYGFKGKNLNIVIKSDSFSLLIDCKKSK